MIDDFAADGQLASAIAGFKPREPQRQMAFAVASAGSDAGETLWQSCRSLMNRNREEINMTITRIDAEARWSDVVIHNQTLYYTGVPSNLDADACAQTADTLAQIDAVLEKQGSSKSRILDATIFLADGADFAAMILISTLYFGFISFACMVQRTGA